jgi:hypothetical protein
MPPRKDPDPSHETITRNGQPVNMHYAEMPMHHMDQYSPQPTDEQRAALLQSGNINTDNTRNQAIMAPRYAPMAIDQNIQDTQPLKGPNPIMMQRPAGLAAPSNNVNLDHDPNYDPEEAHGPLAYAPGTSSGFLQALRG